MDFEGDNVLRARPSKRRKAAADVEDDAGDPTFPFIVCIGESQSKGRAAQVQIPCIAKLCNVTVLNRSDPVQSRDAIIAASSHGKVCDYCLEVGFVFPFAMGPAACDASHFRFMTSDCCEFKASSFADLSCRPLLGDTSVQKLEDIVSQPSQAKVLLVDSRCAQSLVQGCRTIVVGKQALEQLGVELPAIASKPHEITWTTLCAEQVGKSSDFEHFPFTVVLACVQLENKLRFTDANLFSVIVSCLTIAVGVQDR